jgi:hypothetical protein
VPNFLSSQTPKSRKTASGNTIKNPSSNPIAIAAANEF